MATPQEMDQAAEAAKQTVTECRTAQDLILWWKANYKTAGHKRLGRILASMEVSNV